MEKFIKILVIVLAVIAIICALVAAVIKVTDKVETVSQYQNPPRAQIYGGEYVLFS